VNFPLLRRREPSPSFAELYTDQVQEASEAKERAGLAVGWLFAVEPTDRALAGWQGAQGARALFPVPADIQESERAA